MKLNELSPAAGSTSVAKRKGRGAGTGNGKTAGKGHKGQKARSGGSIRPGFEGGQMPLQRRMPKRGFKNIFAKEYAVINLDKLAGFKANSVVTAEKLVEAGIIDCPCDGVKILGTGEVKKKLTVKVAKVTKSAKEKIEAAGGKVEVI